MNVDRDRGGSSVVGVRIVVAGLILVAAGCAVLGWGTRLGKVARSGSASPIPPVLAANSFASPARARSLMAGLPLIFEPNVGQANLDAADPRARFVTHGAGYSMVLGQDGAILSVVARASRGKASEARRVQAFQMKLAGANPRASLSGAEPLPGKSNYFIGNNPSKWRTGVPQFARVRYERVYPGIDLIFYGREGHLEYDFQVAPGADPSQAALDFTGAEKLELKDGSLVIKGEKAEVRLDAPTVYQAIDGRRRPVNGAFVLRGPKRVGFVIGAYDRSRELVIDPILNFSTYFGGSGDEHHTSVAVDGSLNIYLAGSTTSPNLPFTASALQTTLNGAQNVYIAKIQPPLSSQAALLMEMTYLGGEGTDYPVGIQVDGGGNPYIAGTTTSAHFPTTPTTAYQATPVSSGTHVFVTKLNGDFSGLAYSSYLSGNGTDIATGMTIDSAANLYVTGTTTSIDRSNSDQFPATNLPMTLPFQSTSRATAGTPQFFVTKVNTNTFGIGSIPYSTYFGGGTFNGTANGMPAIGGGIAVDSNSNIYFSGTTNFIYSGTSPVTDFPILNAYQPCLDSPPATTILNPQTCTVSASGAEPDAFVAKLNPFAAQGQQLVWSTYLGGTQSDSSTGVALDSGATGVFVVGTTNSQDFVNASLVRSFAPFQSCLNNLPVTPASGTVTCTVQTDPAPTDAFVARLSNLALTTGTSALETLNYFSYLGGANTEEGSAITVDVNSGALITGLTTSPALFTSNLPTDGTFPVTPYPSSIQSQLNGTQDAFVARLNTGAVVGQTTTASWASYFGGTGVDAGTGIALDVNQNSYLAGETNSTDLQVVKPLPTNAANGGGYDSFATQFGTAVSLSLTGNLSMGAGQQYISAGNPAMFTYTLTNNGPDPASNIVVSANLSSQVTGVPLTNVSGSISSGTCGGGGSTNTSITCGPVSLQAGSTATVTITATPTSSSGNNASGVVFFNGGTVQALGQGNIVLAQTSVSAKMSDFRMLVSPSNVSIPIAGATATYTVDLTPIPTYASSITVSCSGLPAASACPSKTVSLANTGGASVPLSITTTARPATGAGLFRRQFYALWLMIPGLAFVGLGGDRRRRRVFGFLGLCIILAMLCLIPACSSTKTQTPPAGTPAGNYSITITASSGTNSKTQTVTLNVP